MQQASHPCFPSQMIRFARPGKVLGYTFVTASFQKAALFSNHQPMISYLKQRSRRLGPSVLSPSIGTDTVRTSTSKMPHYPPQCSFPAARTAEPLPRTATKEPAPADTPINLATVADSSAQQHTPAWLPDENHWLIHAVRQLGDSDDTFRTIAESVGILVRRPWCASWD